MVGKIPKTPNLSPMVDDAITWDGIGGLGSPLYIYESDGGLAEVPTKIVYDRKYKDFV